MITLALAVVAYIRAFCLPRHKLALEAVALRQQLGVFKRKQPRPRLQRFDRLFWVVLRRLWSGWTSALIIVKPETVVSWHRAGFRLLWRVLVAACEGAKVAAPRGATLPSVDGGHWPPGNHRGRTDRITISDAMRD